MSCCLCSRLPLFCLFCPTCHFLSRISISRSITVRVSSKQSNFFSVRTEKNLNSIFFGCFSVCFTKPTIFFFGLFRCFGPVSKQPKQTEKTSKQRSLLGYLRNNYFFVGLNRNKPKLNLFRLFFSLFFSQNPPKYVLFCFGVSDRYRNNRNKQNLWYCELKRFIF
jgi:hypothetical protein